MSADTQLKVTPNSAILDGGPVATPETGRVSELTNRPKLATLILVIILGSSFLLSLSALSPDSFGFYHDDGIYAVMGKALATGHGYRVISLPHEPLQTKSPPFYPFLLSLIWRMYPHFPENLSLMMLLSVAATVSFLAVTYRYLVKHNYATHWQALIVVGLAGFNVYTLILATSIISEMVYAGLAGGALYLAEKYQKRKSSWATGVALGVIIGLAFLTRSSGVTLLIAVTAYYVLKRQWRKSLLPIAVAGVFVICWAGWCYLNRSIVEGVNAAYYESYFQTFNEVIRDLQTQNNATKLIILLGILAKNALGLILISVPMVCLGIPSNLILYFGFVFMFIAAGFLRHIHQQLRLLHVYLISYLSLHLLWPYTTYDRFLIPLLPFLLLFLITEIEFLFLLVRKELLSGEQLVKRISATFIGLALLVTIGLAVFTYSSGIYWSLASASLRKITNYAGKDATAIEWINAHTALSDVLVCERDPIYYLHTGRKATRSSPLKEGALIEGHQTSLDERVQVISRIINDNNARYLILTWDSSEHESGSDLNKRAYKRLVEQHPEEFLPVFESEDGQIEIYRVEQ